MSITVPDGVDVVATSTQAESMPVPPVLVVDTVTGWLDQRGLGTGALSWQRIGDGQSNLTFLLQRGEGENARRMVLRRGPRPPLPPSTHDMMREARFQQVLGPRGVPVPTIVDVEEDPSLLGVPFYVMDLVDGLVVTAEEPQALRDRPEDRARASRAVVDALVRLHSVDVGDPAVAALGRPEGYLRRQVRRFSELWPQVSTRELPDFEPLTRWLQDNCPEESSHAVVHGDFRLGNVMLDPTDLSRVAAVLDWEMATLGDPLADLGYLTATWSDPDWEPTVMDHSPVTTREGWWRRQELVEHYGRATGADLSGLPFYQVLALWKSAVFCEAIRTRFLKGERPGDTFGPLLEEGVPGLLRAARRYIAS